MELPKHVSHVAVQAVFPPPRADNNTVQVPESMNKTVYKDNKTVFDCSGLNLLDLISINEPGL